VFDSSTLVEPKWSSVVERALTEVLGEVAGEGAAAPEFVIDVIDHPTRDAWLRTQIMNRPLRPGSIGEGTLACLLEEGAGHLQRAEAADRRIARESAIRARELADFARVRPSSLMDRAEGETGAASAQSRATRPKALVSVSEWAADEVAVALRLSTSAATALLIDSLVLVEQLPRTLSMLEEGRIGWAQAQVLTELLAPVSDDKRAEAEARVLARAEGRTREQLRAATRRIVARIDATAAAKRLINAIRERQVSVLPGEDGMASLYAALPAPVARACYDALERYADECAEEGDGRTKAQRMADCLADLILCPGEHGLPPVQAQLTVVVAVDTLLGGDEPGEVDGDVVPAPLVRELAYTLGLLPRPADDHPEPAQYRPAPTEDEARDLAGAENEADAPTAGRADRWAQERRALGALLDTGRVGGTALVHRPHIAVVDRLAGTLLALTDSGAIRRGEKLRPPPDSPGYRPREQLDRFVRLRDQRCRFPGCRAQARRCDLDHTRPWPSGRTAHGNLCCLCEHHHRLSHQAPGWRLSPTGDGGLSWRTPGGERIRTYPPPFGVGESAAAATGAAARRTPGHENGRAPTAITEGAADDPPF
jgi:hypothetical protein